MSRKLKFIKFVSEDGKMNFNESQKESMKTFLKAHVGQPIHFSLEYRGRKSKQQRGYYRAVIVKMVMDAMNALGNDFKENDVHEWLKHTFNGKDEVITPDGEVLEIARSTEKNDTFDDMEYFTKIIHFAAETLNIVIPDPDPDWKSNKNKS